LPIPLPQRCFWFCEGEKRKNAKNVRRARRAAAPRRGGPGVTAPCGARVAPRRGGARAARRAPVGPLGFRLLRGAAAGVPRRESGRRERGTLGSPRAHAARASARPGDARARRGGRMTAAPRPPPRDPTLEFEARRGARSMLQVVAAGADAAPRRAACQRTPAGETRGVHINQEAVAMARHIQAGCAWRAAAPRLHCLHTHGGARTAAARALSAPPRPATAARRCTRCVPTQRTRRAPAGCCARCGVRAFACVHAAESAVQFAGAARCAAHRRSQAAPRRAPCVPNPPPARHTENAQPEARGARRRARQSHAPRPSCRGVRTPSRHGATRAPCGASTPAPPPRGAGPGQARAAPCRAPHHFLSRFSRFSQFAQFAQFAAVLIKRDRHT
jgi:hypothetical protein